MSNIHTLDEALGFGYLREGFKTASIALDKDLNILFEAWTGGGDYEGSCHLLEVVIPAVEAIVADSNMDTIHKLYQFYGETLPSALLDKEPITLENIKQIVV